MSLNKVYITNKINIQTDQYFKVEKDEFKNSSEFYIVSGEDKKLFNAFSKSLSLSINKKEGFITIQNGEAEDLKFEVEKGMVEISDNSVTVLI